MLELLAQQPQQPWLLDLIEKLARTPISSVLLFALACTVIRVALHFYLQNRTVKLVVPIPSWVWGSVIAFIAILLYLALGAIIPAVLFGAISLYFFSNPMKIYIFDPAHFFHDLAD